MSEIKFEGIRFQYPKKEIVDRVHNLMQKDRVEKEKPAIFAKDIEEPYNRLREIVHRMDDHGDGLLEELTEIRDELYGLLR